MGVEKRAGGLLVYPGQLPSSEFLVKLLTRGSTSWESTRTASNRSDAYIEFPIVQHDVAYAPRATTIIQFSISLPHLTSQCCRNSEFSENQKIYITVKCLYSAF